MMSGREKEYLIRYGLMGNVGRFPADPALEMSLSRGDSVVLRTERGIEMGEVLILLAGEEARGSQPGDAPWTEMSPADWTRVIRLATPLDLAEAIRVEGLRAGRFLQCREVLAQGGWPVELIDAEPLLDPSTTILHVLGSPEVELGPLRAMMRRSCDFDVILESAEGLGASASLSPQPAPVRGASRCGDCDCGGGGCGTTVPVQAAAAVETCRTSDHGGCASCGIKKLLGKS